MLFKRILLFALIGLACLAFWFFVINKITGCNSNNNDDNFKTVIIHDTTTITRYEKEIKVDTVAKWYEITKTIVKPETIYIQHTDTVFREKVKAMDVMLNVKKKGTTLQIYAYNQNDSLLKEYEYKDVGDNFSATSVQENLVIKSQSVEWMGIDAIANYELPVSNLKQVTKGNLKLGFKTGINYLDKIGLDLFGQYDFTQKGFYTGLQVNFKVLK